MAGRPRRRTRPATGHVTGPTRTPSRVLLLMIVGCLTVGCSTATPVGAGTPSRGAGLPAAREATVSPVRRATPPPTPTVTAPSPLGAPARPPAPLPPWPTREQVRGWDCDRIVRAVNGAAAGCAQPGATALHAEAVGGGELTVGITDEHQRVSVQRGMSADDTYLVAMHERGHQEVRQRCDTWVCGDVLVRALGTTRDRWTTGPYFQRVVEAAASTWARCHGADNPRYGYHLSCRDLEQAFTAEADERRRIAQQQDAFDRAWADYHRAYDRYRRSVATPTP